MILPLKLEVLTWRILVILYLCPASQVWVKAQDLPLKFSYLTVDNGLSHTDTRDIRQDSTGFIWIATLYGLSRYDGHTIKKFYNSNHPLNNAAKNRIQSLAIGSNGRIWLATEGGIQCFDSKKERYLDCDPRIKYSKSQNPKKIVELSSNTIAVLIGAELKLYNVSGERITANDLHNPKNTNFTDFAIDKNGVVYLSANNGVWTLDHNFSFKHYEVISKAGTVSEVISRVFFNQKNELLLYVGNKLLCIDQTFKIETSTHRPVFGKMYVYQETLIPRGLALLDLVQDKWFRYWISSEGGLISLDHKLGSNRLITTDSFVKSLNTNSLTRLFIDRSGCLWASTYGGGVNFCDLNPKLFYTFQKNPQITNGLSGNVIKAVLEENENKVWIGTNTTGLNEYNFKTKVYKHYSTNSPIKLKSNQVSALVFDQDHNLWVGTGKGIDILKADKVADFIGLDKLPTQTITALSKDCYGNIWFSLYNERIGCVVRRENKIIRVLYYGEGHYISADENIPEIMVANMDGVRRYLVNEDGLILKSFHYSVNGKANSLSSPYAWPIKKQNDSTYWIGTMGGGLNRLIVRKNNTYTISSYREDDGIFNDVESIEIDGQGKIWMGGNGLQCFDPKTKKLVTYDQKSGLQGNSFKVGASYTGKNGRLYFGGVNGLNYFNPDSIKTSGVSVRPVFTDIIVNNKKVNVGNKDNPVPELEHVINHSNSLHLDYRQNNFVIYFSSMQFSNPLVCKYRYKLEGFDTDWKYTDGTNPSASYTNLNYENYTLLVEGTNHDGVWGSDRATLDISVSPPWWKSPIANIFYSILVITVLAGIYIYQARWFRLKSELAVRNIEEQKREEIHQQREELYQQQLDFFTNISHEFRTPLTLILGPLEGLMKEATRSEYFDSFKMMHRNAKRLMNLIHELMNFRKLSDSAITLEVKRIYVDAFVNRIYTTFEDLGLNKNIQFEVFCPHENVTAFLDEQVVQKILHNLLANAFKYTQAGGRVRIEVLLDFQEPQKAHEAEFKLLSTLRADRYVYFRILDTGIGISADSISHIFDRYYRVSNDHLGSGIGLALVKKLTLLHQGDIYVYSNRHEGTEIVIGLPLDEHSYFSENLSISDHISYRGARLENVDNTDILYFNTQKNEVDQPVHPDQKAHVLLVEDNDELRFFLKERLKQNYIVYEAFDGKQGYDIACEKMPDLIISDVMMPVMNGVELCRKIKKGLETSHIPFIIVSAKESLEAQVLGLESGADYYFPKPLSVDMLMLTVHNLFNQKRKLRSKYTKDHYVEASDRVHSIKDKEFLDKVITVIEDNIQTPDLDVEFICQEMFISRTKLYQRIQAITGQSVGDFIRTARLQKALHLLTHEDISISEITARVGYTSTSYFSTAFRKEFGKSPLQFLQTIKATQKVEQYSQA
ncbi:hybrid sensor histidine kinase/response regulator transcription factor [Dyadobacter sp. CY312]|uniref:hybrid sensor histidine kinase/response regulator transcription factor n=1 Tax=Dyadobacter sp. CY312 TaxID=2907303 RepID=UPI001F36841A|nr:hybrid sensor histidine kinase/response regulator transcription factor [Dyadobacter sp. CY312]MCE7038940.1 response regulator [Dyadobacter sp. CY312]